MSINIAYSTLSSQDRRLQLTARNVFLLDEFLKVAHIFHEKQVALMPLKGIAFLMEPNADFGNRYMGDIDVLVKEKDVALAVEMLVGLGFQEPRYPFDVKSPGSLSFNSLALTKSGKIPFFIHLHWHILNSSLPLLMVMDQIDMKDIWNEAIPSGDGLESFYKMCLEYEVIFLMLHAFKHSFEKESFFYDIKKVVESNREKINWTSLVSTAQKWGVGLALYYSFCLLNCYWSKELVPVGVIDNVKPFKVSKAGTKFLARITQNKTGSNNLVFPLLIEMADTISKKICFVFLSFFPPISQLKRMYLEKKEYSLYFFYLKRFFSVLLSILRNN